MDSQRNCLHYPTMHGVPTYALYGEQVTDRQHDWLHWETIQSRSSLHRYRIAPHRHEQFFQILSLTGGCGQVTLDGADFDRSAPPRPRRWRRRWPSARRRASRTATPTR
jgi:AraC family transcriptional activator of pobA